MTKHMLIDANHPEETRVVVLDDNQIAEFDFESRAKAPLKGNIYLAKVTRIEPSLQAAFVDYGGNRHGFLPFNEVHPDYYQIPVADREALLREYAAEAKAEASDDASDDAPEDANSEDGDDGQVEDLGGDASEEVRTSINKRNLYRKYKIQEVIKPRQIILVQVLKEERANKGASLTTYLSLAGRYCVLMPNTARGGGISRRINNAADRKKLKTIVGKLDVPQGMGLIVRTAGAKRTLVEIRRDWQYLSHLWEEIRQTTVGSTAPCLVHEEGNLIRRCIRDIYAKEFDDVLVSGKDAHAEARAYMKLLTPTHVRKVKHYTDTVPLFRTYGVEDQLAAMFSPIVVLPSGGYLVINQAEALVAVDVNSGKSTRKYSVEQTALETNLEAATEIARQARLRDLAGLLVIDFIDMDERRNNRAVEKRLKEALRHDRARIQVGHISSFGLLEMSRQRLRAGVLEGSLQTCRQCNGSGMVRSTESRALHVLRLIEEEGNKHQSGTLSVQVPAEVAAYLLNNKRQHLTELETRTGLTFAIHTNLELSAMEMDVTLPGETQSRGVQRMEGDPNAVTNGQGAHTGRGRNRKGQNKGQKKQAKPPRTRTHKRDTAQKDADPSVSESPPTATQDKQKAQDKPKAKTKSQRGRSYPRRGRRDDKGDAAARSAQPKEGDKAKGDTKAPTKAPTKAGTSEASPATIDTSQPKKRGWWQQRPTGSD